MQIYDENVEVLAEVLGEQVENFTVGEYAPFVPMYTVEGTSYIVLDEEQEIQQAQDNFEEKLSYYGLYIPFVDSNILVQWVLNYASQDFWETQCINRGLDCEVDDYALYFINEYGAEDFNNKLISFTEEAVDTVALFEMLVREGYLETLLDSKYVCELDNGLTIYEVIE